MPSTLPQRLRAFRTEDESRHTIEHDITFEAANEVERLRALLDAHGIAYEVATADDAAQKG